MSGVSGVSEGLANLVCLVHLGNLVNLLIKRLAINSSISLEIPQCITMFITLSGISGKISLEWYNIDIIFIYIYLIFYLLYNLNGTPLHDMWLRSWWHGGFTEAQNTLGAL